uniref:Uncharacterized protein n=1 Tax=uncultured Spirochaetaceae bacterium TaxID=201186 RepID=A0A650EPV0_9SPIO|nr:hypothetical protein Unknown280_1840 [uncultured Spirochaetaceae bacterium]
MNDERNFISGAEIVSAFFENIENQKLESGTKILGAWKTTVQKISGNGAQLSDHSRVVDLKNGILLVETDHPAWSQMLQFHKKFILTGLNRICADVKIESLAFRVRGSGVALADSGEKIAANEMKKYSEKLDAQEKILLEKGFLGKEKKFEENEDSNCGEELPENLKEIFARMNSKVAEKN